MKVLNLFFKRGTAAPMLALIFATVMSVSVVTARIVWTGNLRYGFLIWNLFLAWLPLVFALLACDRYCNRAGRSWSLAGLAGAWLVFFPNAPYIFTDLIHLTTYFRGHFWIDMVLILMCALTGLVLGFVSLYLMQSIVTRMFGRAAGWVFIAVSAGLGSFGIFLGRFLRFNSWDVLNPTKLFQGVGNWTAASGYYSLPFLFLFAGFLFVAYLMLYALTHLSPAQMTVTAAK